MSSVDRYKRTFNSQKSGGGGNWLRLEDGETLLRVLDFKHKVTEGDLALGRYLPNEVKIGEVVDEFAVTYRSHFKPERGICGLIKRADKRLVGSCSICQQAADIRKSDTQEDWKAAAQWKVRVAFNVQVVDLDNTPDTIAIWTAPQTFYEWIVKQMESRAYANKTIFGENGLDILVTVDKGSKTPQGIYSFQFMPKEETTPFSLGQLKTSPKDLLRVADFVPPEFQVYIPDPITLGRDGDEKREKKSLTRKRATEAPAASEPEEEAEDAPEPEAKPEPAPAKETPKVGKKRGRPKKDEGTGEDDSIQVGKTVSFKNGDELAEGKVVSGPDKDGLWDVEVAPGDVYGVATEEMILK